MGEHTVGQMVNRVALVLEKLAVADARIKVLEGLLTEAVQENTDLHLVAQGIKHYWLGPHNAAAGNPESPHVCVRCERDALAREGDDRG